MVAVPELKALRQEILARPMSGEIVTLEQVPDQVFASGAMGKGIAIYPSGGILVAPSKRVVSSLFPTKHAIGLRTESGVELLIHIGMDTVSLDGKGFRSFVSLGDYVEAGQKLLEIDLELIQSQNLSIITPVIVTNTADYEDVLLTQNREIKSGDYLMTVLH